MASQAELNSIYSELLGRAPDASGIKTYTPMSAAAVRASVSNSAERQTYLSNSQSRQLSDFAASQKAASDALLARQNAEQEGLFTNYETIRKNQEALPALYSRLQTQAGIPELSGQAQAFKDQIYKTKDQLDRLGEDVVARTTGYNVSDAQRRRLETAESEPLTTNLARLGTGLAPVADMLSSAQQSVSTQLGLETEQQNRELEPVKLRIDAISDRFARELTGFNADRELQLTSILDKLKRDRELSDREWQAAQDLAAEERAYARQKASAVTQLSKVNTGSAPTSAPTAAYRALPSLPAAAPKKAAPAPVKSVSTYSPPKPALGPVKTSQSSFSIGGLKF